MTITEFQNIISYIRDAIADSPFEGKTYVVGGAVRDFVRYAEIKDIDIVVNLENGGVSLPKYLHSKGLLTDEPKIASSFGTASWKLKDFPNEVIESVHTRAEDYIDRTSRNPQVRFGTLEEDAKRRDFTINAIYLNVTSNVIWDSSNEGMLDIERGFINCVDDPDIIFSDDPLRMLRAIRFSSVLGYGISLHTWEGIIKNAHRLQIIVPERIQTELDKILLSSYVSGGIDDLVDSGLMDYIIPRVCLMKGMKQNKYHHQDVFHHTLSVLTRCMTKDLTLRMAALMHDIGKTTTLTVDDKGVRHFYNHELESGRLTEYILNKLRYPKKFISDVRFLVEHHMDTKQLGQFGQKIEPHHVRRLQYFCKTKEQYNRLIELIDADNNAHHPDYRLYQLGELKAKSDMLDKEGTSGYGYKPPIDGNEIKAILGNDCPPKAIGYTNKRLIRYCLSKDKLPTIDECKKYVKQNTKYFISKFLEN